MSELSKKLVPVRDVIAISCNVFRTLGYTPAKREITYQAGNWVKKHHESRNSNACKIQDHFYGTQLVTLDADDYDIADKIIEYFSGLAFKIIERKLSGFEKSIFNFIIEVNVPIWQTGQAAILPKIYLEQIDADNWTTEEMELASKSKFVDKIDDRKIYSIVPTYTKHIKNSDSTFVVGLINGTNIVKCYVPDWCFTPKVGRPMQVTGTVRAHETSSLTGAKQTKLCIIVSAKK